MFSRLIAYALAPYARFVCWLEDRGYIERDPREHRTHADVYCTPKH